MCEPYLGTGSYLRCVQMRVSVIIFILDQWKILVYTLHACATCACISYGMDWEGSELISSYHAKSKSQHQLIRTLYKNIRA